MNKNLFQDSTIEKMNLLDPKKVIHEIERKLETKLKPFMPRDSKKSRESKNSSEKNVKFEDNLRRIEETDSSKFFKAKQNKSSPQALVRIALKFKRLSPNQKNQSEVTNLIDNLKDSNPIKNDCENVDYDENANNDISKNQSKQETKSNDFSIFSDLAAPMASVDPNTIESESCVEKKT